MERLDVDICGAPEVAATCCVLHNICEIHGDTFDEWLEGVETQVCNSVHIYVQALFNQRKVNIRNTFMSYFTNKLSYFNQ